MFCHAGITSEVSGQMSEEVAVAGSAIDFVIVAWREGGRWHTEALPKRIASSLETVIQAVRAQPAEGGALGMVSVNEDWFLLVRVVGGDVRMLVSDVYAAEISDLGLEALDRLGPSIPDDDESDEPVPGGDFRILEDFGLPVDELELILDDSEAYPDEQLADIADHLGFGDTFDALI